MAAHTPLPPVGLPTHTTALAAVHVHIIAQRLRRVNRFLRPWAARPAWTQTTLRFSNCIRFSRPSSSLTFIWTLLQIPAVFPASCANYFAVPPGNNKTCKEEVTGTKKSILINHQRRPVGLLVGVLCCYETSVCEAAHSFLLVVS